MKDYRFIEHTESHKGKVFIVTNQEILVHHGQPAIRRMFMANLLGRILIAGFTLSRRFH
jgi:hypothetical protein